MSGEHVVQPKILLALGRRPEVRVFRNHVGRGWTGHLVRREGEFTILRNARATTFGLAPGSSDIIGMESVLVTPAMVGTRLAVFLACEVKGATTRTEEHQSAFLGVVRDFGGIAGIARSPDEAVALLMGGGA